MGYHSQGSDNRFDDDVSQCGGVYHPNVLLGLFTYLGVFDAELRQLSVAVEQPDM